MYASSERSQLVRPTRRPSIDNQSTDEPDSTFQSFSYTSMWHLFTRPREHSPWHWEITKYRWTEPATMIRDWQPYCLEKDLPSHPTRSLSAEQTYFRYVEVIQRISAILPCRHEMCSYGTIATQRRTRASCFEHDYTKRDSDTITASKPFKSQSVWC